MVGSAARRRKGRTRRWAGRRAQWRGGPAGAGMRRGRRGAARRRASRVQISLRGSNSVPGMPGVWTRASVRSPPSIVSPPPPTVMFGGGEDEVVEASRLKRAHLRSRRACVSACESLSTTRMADDRRRVDRLWPTEDLVSPGVVVVGMRVDDEEAPRVLCRAAQRRELQRERGSAVRVDDDEPARGLDDELSTSSSQRNRRRRGSRPSGASVSSFE